MENECQLLGIRQYSSYLKSNGEEDHLSISPYVEWIRETIAKGLELPIYIYFRCIKIYDNCNNPLIYMLMEHSKILILLMQMYAN
uniref:Uncharacterized protein n=1 Tax=Romanomermis culicivorax TaxID=13658 RepID=A0A915KRD4_ROMCU